MNKQYRALLSIRGWDIQLWLETLKAALPNIQFYLPQDEHNVDDIDFAFVWKAPLGSLEPYTNLKALFCLGAGVDALMSDTKLPNTQIARVVDPSLTLQMTQWVVWQCLHHVRLASVYQNQQTQKIWLDHRNQPLAHELRVGMMGMGTLGLSSANALKALGFQVHGWTRSKPSNSDFKIYQGQDQLDSFLNNTDILVSLLPLTAQTKGILNFDLFTKLAKGSKLGGAVLLNAGRGGLQIEADILRALNEGILKAASLDVFETEPLPTQSELWSHPRVVITPHNAAVSDPKSIANLLFEQIKRLKQGQDLLYKVDIQKGY